MFFIFELLINLVVDLSLTEADLASTESFPVVSASEIVIKSTPTGFLRVRSEPSLKGNEVGKVYPKDKVTLLEELSGWDIV